MKKIFILLMIVLFASSIALADPPCTPPKWHYDSSGNLTPIIDSKTLLIPTADINGGTIDGTVIGGTTPGIVRGYTDEIVQAATDTLTVAECAGTIINNYGQGSANTQTLPAAAEGLSGTVCISAAGVGAFNLKAGAGDKIYLNGTATADGEKASLATPAVGDFFTFYTVQTEAAAWDWVVTTGIGTLVNGGV